MKPRYTLLAALAMGLLAAPAFATVLSFDDIASDGALPDGYGGLDWSSAGWTVFSLPQEPYTAHSGDGRIAGGFQADDASTRIGFGQLARFDGAWVAGLQGATLSFQLYLNGALVHESQVLDPSGTPSFLASGYAGWVDSVVVHSANHGEFVLDDLSFTAAVPEPQIALLLAGGLLALALRRRQQH